MGDFGLHLSSLMSELGSLGDIIDQKRVVQKIRQIVPKRYKQLAWSIESLIDLNSLSVKELIWRLTVAND
jgi:hypothetical protein